MSADWQRVRGLFEEIVEVDQRDAERRLAEVARVDSGLAAEVRSLLEHHSLAGQFMTSPVASLFDESDDDVPASSGELIGAYRIEREIGRGGMGRVYLATDTRLNRPVALKLLPASVAHHPAQRERLRREARAAALLSHPGICAVFALEEVDDRIVVVTEYLEGRALRDEIQRGDRSTPAAVAGAARELSDALAAAHAQGVTHRDLKPENIMRTRDGRLKILDFGLALVEHPSFEDADRRRLTLPGAVIGTPAYMAPEQLNGGAADARTDVFALGVVLYELATGVHPFEAATPMGIAARVIESQPTPLQALRPDLGAGLAAVIDRAMRKAPEDRFATAAAFRQALTLETPVIRVGGATVVAWWRRHQLIVIAFYLLATAAAWQAKEWMPGVPRVLFPFVGILAVVAAVFRGHLLFAERQNHRSFPVERLRGQAVTAVTDVAIGAALLVDGALASDARPVASLLVMALGVAIALTRVVIERATTRGAFEGVIG